MKELTKKETIIALIALIILAVTAMILIIKREIEPQESGQEQIIEAEQSENNALQETNNASAVQTKKADAEENTVKDSADTEKDMGSGNGECLTYTKDDWQMKELFGYWDQYQLDAVEDLIRLQRVRAITKELKGTDNYFYYGDKNKKGEPQGKGLAIYADDTYYCGSFKNGLRDGEGMWLQIFPDKAVTLNHSKGVTEHSYNGEFSNHYPNGKGQEHFEYDVSLMEEKENLANVIGYFKDGYYDGELYIMTITSKDHTNDWNATAKKGKYIPIENKKNTMGKEPVWNNMETKESDNDQYLWMHPSVNYGFGIDGLKK